MRLVDMVNGEEFGRDPRKVSLAEFHEAGHVRTPLLKVIRAKCIDCCASYVAEVANCVSQDCALWPYRMGVNPIARLETSPEKKAARAEQARRVFGRNKDA